MCSSDLGATGGRCLVDVVPERYPVESGRVAPLPQAPEIRHRGILRAEMDSELHRHVPKLRHHGNQKGAPEGAFRMERMTRFELATLTLAR